MNIEQKCIFNMKKKGRGSGIKELLLPPTPPWEQQAANLVKMVKFVIH